MIRLKIADRWFSRKSWPDGIHQLWEPHVHPLIRCNIWLVRGRDRDLLVDTGLGVAPLAEEIAALTQRPLVVVATHFHYDHVGSLHEFGTRLMHPSEAGRRDPYADRTPLVVSDYSASDLAQYAAAGYHIDPDSAFLIDALPHADFDPRNFTIQPARPTGLLDEGDQVDLGDRHFEVLHLPGHSPGSIGLLESSSGILFTGDAIYDGPLLDELPESDIDDYVASMERLRSIEARVIHPGHEASFDGQRLVELADAYLMKRSKRRS